MIHETSYRTRRIVGQLEAGDELVEELTQLCESDGVQAGEVRVIGALRHVELAYFDTDSKNYKVAHEGGPAEIVHLSGTVAIIGEQVFLRLEGLLSAPGPFGEDLVSGQIRSAQIEACEFILEVFEDLRVVRKRDPETGRTVFSGITREEPPEAPAGARAPTPTPKSTLEDEAPAPAETKSEVPSPKQPSISWEQAAQASEGGKKRKKGRKSSGSSAPSPEEIYADVSLPEEEGRPEMKPGDILEHPKFGRCRILKVEEEEYAHVRLPRGRTSKLVLEIFEIQHKGSEDGRDVFSLRIRKR